MFQRLCTSPLKVAMMFALVYCSLANSAKAQCSVCLPDSLTLAGMPADTIYLDSVPPAQKGAYYEEHITFRLPYTTDPLSDFGAPPGIDINYFELVNIQGLPPGLSWKLDRDPAIYDEDAPDTRDGCLNLCGTPGAHGTFNVLIDIIVNVDVLGDQPNQIPLEFVVLPDSSAGFFPSANILCDSGWVSFTNTIPSGGSPDISYDWDFGNGQTSTLEDPDSVLYQDTGTYVVTYTAIIDTFPFYLSNVRVEASDCNDDAPPFNTAPPDFYLVLKDGSGTEVINNDPNVPFGSGNDPDDVVPADAWTGQYTLDLAQTYTAEIWDDDNMYGNADDACGSFVFTATTTQTSFTDGVHEFTLTLTHIIDTVFTVDTIKVNNCIVGTESLEQIEQSLNVYPNPTDDYINVSFHLYAMQEDVELTIIDVLGHELLRKDIPQFEGNYRGGFDLSNYSQGIYLLRVRAGDQVAYKRIIVR